jgi:hypothetical protein
MTEIPLPMDLSHLSDEEVNRLAAGENIYLRAQPKPPPNIGGRPKGYPASGAAKISKERAQARREREQRERAARAHP